MEGLITSLNPPGLIFYIEVYFALIDKMRRIFGDLSVDNKFTMLVDSRRCERYRKFRNITEAF
jgi:hypothetical protein